jgi:hypothetical protein
LEGQEPSEETKQQSAPAGLVKSQDPTQTRPVDDNIGENDLTSQPDQMEPHALRQPRSSDEPEVLGAKPGAKSAPEAKEASPNSADGKVPEAPEEVAKPSTENVEADRRLDNDAQQDGP